MIRIELPESSLYVEEHDDYRVKVWDDSENPARLAEELTCETIEEVYEVIQNFLKSEMGL